MFQRRSLELSGCCNLRDLGGYRTRSGASVAWHRLFRGGALSRLNPEVAGYLVHDLGIRRIIDLRAVEEIGDAACPLPEPCQRVSVPFLTSFRSHWIQPSDQRPEATAARYLEMLEQGLPSLGRILRLLVAAPLRPTLLHCVAGRDRTGIVIALILDLLEVPEEVIAADYALSDGAGEDGARAHAETIHHLLELITKRHASTRELLLRTGVASECIDQLRHILLDPGSGASTSSGTVAS